MDVESVDYENHTATVKLRQYKENLVIWKPRGATLYSVRFAGSAPIPNELSGKYTTIAKALEHIQQFSLVAKETFAVKSDRLHKDRQERHAAADKSTNGK